MHSKTFTVIAGTLDKITVLCYLYRHTNVKLEPNFGIKLYNRKLYNGTMGSPVVIGDGVAAVQHQKFDLL